MFYKVKILFLFILSVVTHYTFAQGELETEREPDKYNINSYGVKLNSNGYGIYYAFSHKINHKLRNYLEAEYNYQKSLKEVKVINQINDEPLKKFVFGKTYSVHNIKFGYGYSTLLFDKRDKNSISIRLSGSLGGIFALSKPIYYEIIDSVMISNNYMIPYTSYKRIDVNFQNNPTDILCKAPFSYGLNEIKPNFGIYSKVGFQFDFSQNVMKTRTLEVGTILDVFILPIEIMAGHQKELFFNLYLCYHFGKKYDTKLNREFRKEQRKNSIKK